MWSEVAVWVIYIPGTSHVMFAAFYNTCNWISFTPREWWHLINVDDMLHVHALVCFLLHHVYNKHWVLRDLRCPWKGAFCEYDMMYPVKGAKPPTGHLLPQGNGNPLVTSACYSPASPYTQTHAPIDAQHPGSTAQRTKVDWLQLYNDDKSHKRCQRHSDGKKHPLKIHPEHIAFYFKHSPTPRFGP